MGGLVYFLFILFVFCIAQALRIFTDYWLGLWAEDKFGISKGDYVGAYAGLSIGSAIFFLIRFALFITFSLRISKNIFQGLLKVVLRAPMWFFDITPLGRIIARFTSDMDKVDFMLSITL
jgi:ATP-binding cassette, subfamily C (CFTR/MRP), member 1